MQQLNYKREESIGELIGDLTRESTTLVRQELQLAKLELKQSAMRVGKGAGFMGASALLGNAAMLALLAGVIALLATFMAVWLAALIVAAVCGAVAWLLLQRGMKLIKEDDLAPTETIETVREDVLWLTKKR